MISTKAIILFLVVFTIARCDSATRRVDVSTLIPALAVVEGPDEVLLAPGETCIVTLRVASNLPWLLSLQTDNPRVTPSGRHTGTAGGMLAAGNAFAVVLTCAADADGPQRAVLEKRLITGSRLADLPR